MDNWFLLLNPWVQLLVKMLLVFVLLLLLRRCQFTAAHHAQVWRIGLMVLLFLPWLNWQFGVFEIPLLLENTFPQTASILPTAGPNINQTSTLPAFNLTMALGLIAASVSLALLIRIIGNLIQLYQVTGSASEVSRNTWHQVTKDCVKQLSLQQSPTVKITNMIATPCTWGVFRPVVLIPQSVKDDETYRMVLMHELSHIKRKDWMWLMVAQMITALFWFNPILWWVKSQLIQSFEAACDEMVLQQKVRPSSYAETLLSFHQARQHALTQMATMMAQPSAMYLRLNHILNPQIRSQTMHAKKQNLLLLSASLATALITVSQLTIAHDVSSHEPHVKSATFPNEPVPRPDPVSEPHLATVVTPAAIHEVATPPRPHSLATHPEPVTSQVPQPEYPQTPEAPHATHIHESSVHDQAPEVVRELKQQAMELRRETEHRLQKQQMELKQLSQQHAKEKAELKQQMAQLEKQRKQLLFKHQQREAKLSEVIEQEKQMAREEMKKLEMAQLKLRKEAKRVQAQLKEN